MQWWLDTYSKGSPSHDRNKFSVDKNLIGSELGSPRLVRVTPATIDVLLQSRAAQLSPQTLNHLRQQGSMMRPDVALEGTPNRIRLLHSCYKTRQTHG